MAPKRKGHAAIARNKRRPTNSFRFDAAAGKTLLLWIFTGVAGSGAVAVAFLCSSLGWEALGAWLAVILPGTLIGGGQRVILRSLYGATVSGFWLAGSVTGVLVFLALLIPRDELLAYAFLAGVLGMLPGFLQMQDLTYQFVRGNWWMTLSALSHALGCTLALGLGALLPGGRDIEAALIFPCVAIFTGIAIAFVARDRSS